VLTQSIMHLDYEPVGRVAASAECNSAIQQITNLRYDGSVHGKGSEGAKEKNTERCQKRSSGLLFRVFPHVSVTNTANRPVNDSV
jgi:hypothetical protein